MKITDIEQGKKYFKKITKHEGRSHKRTVTVIKIYMLEVNTSKMQVFASFNGGPPEWVGAKSFAMWTKHDPTTSRDLGMTSDYTYQFRKVRGHSFIMIEDSDKGKATVTNNIDWVIKQIAKKENINPVEFNIIYKDSMNIWDGYNFATRMFYPIQEAHWLKAAIKSIEKYG